MPGSNQTRDRYFCSKNEKSSLLTERLGIRKRTKRSILLHLRLARMKGMTIKVHARSESHASPSQKKQLN
tara:strand:- start:595 stop:804 length:210 start_codon:yes stop_codon:yes gene_type:complete